MRIVAVLVVVVGIGALGVVGAGSLAQVPPPPPPPPPPPAAPPPAPMPTAPLPTTPSPTATAPAQPAGPSRALGLPCRGRLVNGVALREVSADWLTWDPSLNTIPNRPERRLGTANLIATLKRALAGFHAAHPELPQVLIG